MTDNTKIDWVEALNEQPATRERQVKPTKGQEFCAGFAIFHYLIGISLMVVGLMLNRWMWFAAGLACWALAAAAMLTYPEDQPRGDE